MGIAYQRGEKHSIKDYGINIATSIIFNQKMNFIFGSRNCPWQYCEEIVGHMHATVEIAIWCSDTMATYNFGGAHKKNH